jgi:hypothetical protein
MEEMGDAEFESPHLHQLARSLTWPSLSRTTAGPPWGHTSVAAAALRHRVVLVKLGVAPQLDGLGGAACKQVRAAPAAERDTARTLGPVTYLDA